MIECGYKIKKGCEKTVKIESPMDLLERIRNNTLTSKDLSFAQRRLCVEYLDASGWSEANMATFFEVHRNTIYSDLKKIHQVHGEMLLKTKFEHILGHLITVKKHVQAKLSTQKKWKDVWIIEREFLEKLQGLGVVFKQPEELKIGEVTGEDTLIGMKEKTSVELAAALERIRQKNKKLTQSGHNERNTSC